MESTVPEVNDRQELEAVVRGIASAGKALKLYPSTSPIPRESVEAATVALTAFLDSHPLLSLTVAREGFGWSGQQIGAGMVGVSDLADALRDHGVAEVDFLPGCSASDLLAFIDLITHDPGEVHDQGGFAALLAAAGVDNVRAADVQITVLDPAAAAALADTDGFLEELASDPEKLHAWMLAATAGDPTAFGEGLAELAQIAGDAGMERFLESLSTAFMRLAPENRDVLLGLSFDQGSVRDVASGMFGQLDAGQIAGTLTGGLYGDNMLSLSNALTGLPLESRIEQVKAQVQSMLKDGGHADKEIGFLEHMVEVRRLEVPEPALVDSQALYKKVALAAAMPPEEIEKLRAETTGSTASRNRIGVATMLALLDQQRDFEMYCRGLDGLAAMVPKLIETGELTVARTVLNELMIRQSRTQQPWPELTERLRTAVAAAVPPEAMAALLRAVKADPSALPAAREIARVAGDAAGPAIIDEAMAHQGEGLRAAEDILGRQVIDLLAMQLPRMQWFHLAPAVARLALETDPRAQAAIETAARRSDEQSRREVANGLSQADTPLSLKLLSTMTADPSAEVAIAAVRAMSKMSTPGGSALLGARLGSLDIDNKDFLLGREIIGALVRMPDPEAEAVLKKLASRKALIKRGHFVEIQDLAQRAVAARGQKGGA